MHVSVFLPKYKNLTMQRKSQSISWDIFDLEICLAQLQFNFLDFRFVQNELFSIQHFLVYTTLDFFLVPSLICNYSLYQGWIMLSGSLKFHHERIEITHVPVYTLFAVMDNTTEDSAIISEPSSKKRRRTTWRKKVWLNYWPLK